MKLVDGWYINDYDAEVGLHPVRYQMAKDIRVIPAAMKHVKNRGCVIQAGARIGLWPRELSTLFAKVVAFEPESKNYECAKANLEHTPNVELHNAALADRAGQRWVSYSPKSSSHWIVDAPPEAGEMCNVVTIDSYGLTPDAIFLDIEGYELAAMNGARETIARCLPVMILEENNARLRYDIPKGALAKWLAEFGYKPVDNIGKDVILVSGLRG